MRVCVCEGIEVLCVYMYVFPHVYATLQLSTSVLCYQ